MFSKSRLNRPGRVKSITLSVKRPPFYELGTGLSKPQLGLPAPVREWVDSPILAPEESRCRRSSSEHVNGSMMSSCSALPWNNSGQAAAMLAAADTVAVEPASSSSSSILSGLVTCIRSRPSSSSSSKCVRRMAPSRYCIRS